LVDAPPPSSTGGQQATAAANATASDQPPTQDWVDINQTGLFSKHKKLLYKKYAKDVYVAKNLYNAKYRDYIITNSEGFTDFSKFLDHCRPIIKAVLEDEIGRNRSIKSNMSFSNVFVNPLDLTMEYAYKCPNNLIVNEINIDEHIETQLKCILSEIENRDLNSSGFTLKLIKHLEVRTSKVSILPGSGYIQLPKWIRSKRAVINVNTFMGDCFKWCILVPHYPNKRHPGYINAKFVRENEHMYNFDINFPTSIADVDKFCKLNSDVSVNVYGVMEREEIVYPLYLCKEPKEKHYDLLYLENDFVAHYCLITNFSRLMRSQSKGNRDYFHCRRCLLGFDSRDKLETHTSVCGNEKVARIVLPDQPKDFCFSKFDACQLAPLVMTFDMESLLLPISTAAPSPNNSFTLACQLHVPVSYGAYLYSHLPSSMTKDIPLGYHSRICYDDDDLGKELISYLDSVTLKVKELWDSRFKIHMLMRDEMNFQRATSCYLCKQPFKTKKEKVRDHDHFKEYQNYRGAAHAKCNILLRKRLFLPCYVHSLSSYDAHHLIKIFVKNEIQSIRVIPCTLEKYVSVSVWLNGVEVRFLDSYRLLNSSLGSITAALPEEKFVETKRTFASNLHSLLRTKGPFPYTFMHQVANLDHTEYPERKWFDNDLTGEKITDDEYERGRLIWEVGECKTFRDFLYIYQCSDTTQLMDCVLYVRTLFWEKFGLDCTFYVSLPHLSLSAMLKHTGVQIELMTDVLEEAHEMIGRSIYGGLTSVGIRYVESDDNNHMIYCDANSLYSFVMQEYPMAIGGYKFVDTKLHDWRNFPVDGDTNYFLEVDISYPRECMDYLDCYPPIPERKIPPGGKTPRLLQDFEPKKRYVMTLAHFQLVLRLGACCENIWRVLEFKQSNFMKLYVEVISKWRREAKSTCESNFYKLILNSLYGKMNERLAARRDIRIVTSESQLKKLVRKGNFLDRHIFTYKDFQLTIVEMAKRVVKQDRPMIIGSLILSYSKCYMMSFWYDVLKPAFKEKDLKLLMTDTDSFIFKVTTNTLNQDLLAIKDHFDFSNLPKDHVLYSPTNAKVFGKFKDESSGERILSFCSPRVKCYSLLYEDDEMNKLKGIAKHYVKRHLHHDDYKKCVLERESMYASFKTIQSRQHNLYTVNVNKLALEPTDMKRYILPDGINTRAYGHYSLLDENESVEMEVSNDE
jgi:hypothetical protein